MIDITLVQLDHNDSIVDEFHAALLVEEQLRAAGMRRAEDRSRYVITRALLRTLLGRRLGIRPRDVALALAARGKPVLAAAAHPVDTALHFNVAHSGNWAALALAGYPVGIDVEQMRELDVAAVAAQVFDPAMCHRMACEADPRDYFFRQWTLREAQWKASGVGLAGAQSDRAGVDQAFGPAQVFPVALAPGYYGAVCVLGAPGLVHTTDIHVTTCRAAEMLARVNE